MPLRQYALNVVILIDDAMFVEFALHALSRNVRACPVVTLRGAQENPPTKGLEAPAAKPRSPRDLAEYGEIWKTQRGHPGECRGGTGGPAAPNRPPLPHAAQATQMEHCQNNPEQISFELLRS